MILRKLGKKGLICKVLAGLEIASVMLGIAGVSGNFVTHSAAASTLSIPLVPAGRVQKLSATYTCSGSKELLDKLAKPSVSVTYLNAGAVSLAVMAVEGQTQVFSNVIAASGARYTANRFEWWSKGDTAFFSEFGADDTARLTCQVTHKATQHKAR